MPTLPKTFPTFAPCSHEAPGAEPLAAEGRLRCCPRCWEAAYLQFETPAEEVRKFRRRLLRLGARRWPRSAAIVELFCGRGSGLHALGSLGFTRVEGVDLSPRLVAEYAGPFRVQVADCRALPFADAAQDVMIVQGGLHHLERLPEDLDQVIGEVGRVLAPAGLFVVVEPWMTPFLAAVHAVCGWRWAGELSPKVAALATMIRHEQPTYSQWLAHGPLIRSSLESRFEPVRLAIGWGKLCFVGRKRGRTPHALPGG
jgi:SAM-dependent methyltransferase